MKVTLTIEGDERNGEKFEFTEPGSLLFGRSKKAQCRIQKDPYVSRNHFLLVINPSDVRLRNLSPTNGTEVDGVLYTQAKHVQDDSEAQTIVKGDDTDEPAEAILHDGSQIECGYTRIAVSVQEDAVKEDVGQADAVESPPDVFCGRCGGRIPGQESEAARHADYFVCLKCRKKKPIAEQGVGRLPRRVSPPPRRRPGLPQRGRLSGEADKLMEAILRSMGMPKPTGRIPRIPGYNVLTTLAVAGQGVVFKAVRLSDTRTVALKMIKPECRMSSTARSRFKREITIARQLKHEHIVECLDSGEVDGALWMVMEYIEDGHDVGKHIVKRGGRIPEQEAVALIIQALEALAFAFSQNGIVHRDIKPPNILLAARGSGYSAKLSDFGLAKSLEDAGLNCSVITRPSACMGTIPYMPPEQVIDVRTAKPTADVFSMGATLYQMLTGKLVRDFPTRHSEQNEMLRQVVQDPVIPVEKRTPSICPGLALAINKSLELDPEDRFQDAGAFAAELRDARS